MQTTLRRRVVTLLTGIAVAAAVATALGQASKKTDAQIRQEMIAASIAAYKGSCPCPYNTDKAGHKCGARSAYSRPGGASPLCYEKDITQKTVDDYRKQHRL